MILDILVISAGAACGAILRWLIGNLLNPVFPAIPPGTLTVNLLGSFIMGLIMGIMSFSPLNGTWRLLIITGFLGSLTTFSTFAADISALIIDGKSGMAFLAVIMHVGGSILMLFSGIWLLILMKKLTDF